MHTTMLRITGMTCDHCARTIEGALNSLPDVKARVSYKDARAEVEAPNDLSPERLVEAVQAKGYGASRLEGVGTPKTASGDGKLHVAIIGSGSAAFACAIRAAEEGARVTIIEAAEAIGGTCVNIGCVPSKIMIRSAHIAHLMNQQPFDGIRRVMPTLDRPKLVAQQQARVAALRQTKYQNILDSHPSVNLLKGKARFKDMRTIIVTRADGSQKVVRADRFLIAAAAVVAGLLFASLFTLPTAIAAMTGISAGGRRFLHASAVATPFITAVLLFGAAIYLWPGD